MYKIKTSLFVKQNSVKCAFSNSESWTILSPIEQRIKQKIEAIGTPLKDWDISINYGIKTGCNEAFIIDEAKKNELIADDPKSAEIIRPILRGRDIKRYGYSFADLYLIAAHNGIPDKHKYPLSKLLALGKMSRSTYYYQLKRLGKTDKYSEVKEQIKKIFEHNKGRYGYRRVHVILRQQGIALNHKTTQRLMASMKLQGKQRRHKYRSYRGEIGKVASNILNRQFEAQKPFEKLVTDVTEFHVCNEKIYLSPVMDLFNREIVAHAISRSPSFAQTRAMLEQLFARLPKDATPLMHSDQGWQYQMREYQAMLKEHNITQSMSRKGNCLDNSVMENFFGRLKTEMFIGENFTTIEDFQQKLEEYICYFNNERVSLKLKGMSPVQYRTHSM